MALEDSMAKRYVRAIVMADSLNKALGVRLDILFDQDQLVTEEEDNEREDLAQNFIAELYEETDDLYNRQKTVIEVLSFIEENIKQKEFILSILEDAQRRRGKKIDGKVMKVLLQYKQHFDDDCLGKSPVVDKIERFRNERGFMKTIFEDRIYNPWPSLDRNKNKSSNVERKQIILSRKERLMTIDEDSNLGKLEQEAQISRLWEKLKLDNKDRQTCAD